MGKRQSLTYHVIFLCEGGTCKPTGLTQPSILKWSVNRVPACLAGVKAWCVHLCRIAGNTVWTVWSHMASDTP